MVFARALLNTRSLVRSRRPDIGALEAQREESILFPLFFCSFGARWRKVEVNYSRLKSGACGGDPQREN